MIPADEIDKIVQRGLCAGLAGVEPSAYVRDALLHAARERWFPARPADARLDVWGGGETQPPVNGVGKYPIEMYLLRPSIAV